jgi:serine/threonine protein kinase
MTASVDLLGPAMTATPDDRAHNSDSPTNPEGKDQATRSGSPPGDSERTGYPPTVDPEATRYSQTGDPEATRYPPTAPLAPPGSRRGGRRLPCRFGDYELLEEIARGGMGIVYKARQLALGRVVALKMILSGHGVDPEEIERFQRDARSAGALDHPGIVPIFDVGEVEGEHYFTMPLIEGGNLQKCLADGPLPAKEGARLVRLVAEAVQYAHEHGIIHRDLKPHNILVTAASPELASGLAAERTPSGSGTRTAGVRRVRVGGGVVRPADGPAAVPVGFGS